MHQTNCATSEQLNQALPASNNASLVKDSETASKPSDQVSDHAKKGGGGCFDSQCSTLCPFMQAQQQFEGQLLGGPLSDNEQHLRGKGLFDSICNPKPPKALGSCKTSQWGSRVSSGKPCGQAASTAAPKDMTSQYPGIPCPRNEAWFWGLPKSDTAPFFAFLAATELSDPRRSLNASSVQQRSENVSELPAIQATPPDMTKEHGNLEDREQDSEASAALLREETGTEACRQSAGLQNLQWYPEIKFPDQGYSIAFPFISSNSANEELLGKAAQTSKRVEEHSGAQGPNKSEKSGGVKKASSLRQKGGSVASEHGMHPRAQEAQRKAWEGGVKPAEDF